MLKNENPDLETQEGDAKKTGAIFSGARGPCTMQLHRGRWFGDGEYKVTLEHLGSGKSQCSQPETEC